MDGRNQGASKPSKRDSSKDGTPRKPVPVLLPTKSMSMVIHNSPTTEKNNCLCAPTTHAGSFRCRQHRNSGLKRVSKSVGSGLNNLAAKSPSLHNKVEAAAWLILHVIFVPLNNFIMIMHCLGSRVWGLLPQFLFFQRKTFFFFKFLLELYVYLRKWMWLSQRVYCLMKYGLVLVMYIYCLTCDEGNVLFLLSLRSLLPCEKWFYIDI